MTRIIADSNANVQIPRIGIDRAGNMIIARVEANLIYFSQYNAATNTWTHPTSTSDHISFGSAWNLLLAMNGRGDAAITWVESSIGGLYVSLYSSLSRTWTHPTNSVADNFAATSPVTTYSLSMSSNGHILLCWVEQQQAYARIYLPQSGWQPAHALTVDFGLNASAVLGPQWQMYPSGGIADNGYAVIAVGTSFTYLNNSQYVTLRRIAPFVYDPQYGWNQTDDYFTPANGVTSLSVSIHGASGEARMSWLDSVRLHCCSGN